MEYRLRLVCFVTNCMYCSEDNNTGNNTFDNGLTFSDDDFVYIVCIPNIYHFQNYDFVVVDL
jgi:hypothetical protein